MTDSKGLGAAVKVESDREGQPLFSGLRLVLALDFDNGTHRAFLLDGDPIRSGLEGLHPGDGLTRVYLILNEAHQTSVPGDQRITASH